MPATDTLQTRRFTRLAVAILIGQDVCYELHTILLFAFIVAHNILLSVHLMRSGEIYLHQYSVTPAFLLVYTCPYLLVGYRAVKTFTCNVWSNQSNLITAHIPHISELLTWFLVFAFLGNVKLDQLFKMKIHWTNWRLIDKIRCVDIWKPQYHEDAKWSCILGIMFMM